jgi:hypothetical protein
MGLIATICRKRLLALAPLVCALVALVALPTAALARTPRDSGGGGIGATGGNGSTTTSTTPTTSTTTGSTNTSTGGATTPSGATQTTPPAVVKLSGFVNVSGDGISLTVSAAGTEGHPMTLTGRAPATDGGSAIDIETARASGGSWTQVATGVVTASGAFSATWTPSTSAQVAIRAVLATGISGSSTGTTTTGGGGLPGPDAAAAASTPATTAALTIPIFRNAVATIYGPGFWGHHTACGERLRRSMLGIASRTLRCGSRVAVYYRGRELTVPVIDRGPFANGASWDLTMATARALGVTQTTTIGTLSPAPASVIAARA